MRARFLQLVPKAFSEVSLAYLSEQLGLPVEVVAAGNRITYLCLLCFRRLPSAALCFLFRRVYAIGLAANGDARVCIPRPCSRSGKGFCH